MLSGVSSECPGLNLPKAILSIQGIDNLAGASGQHLMRVCIADSHVSWGGMGQFTTNLAKTLKGHSCEVVGLVTHEEDERTDEYKAIVDDYHYVGGLSKLRKYFGIGRIINRIQPDILLINHVGTVHFLLPLLRRQGVVSVIHSDQEDFYRIASIGTRYIDAWVAPSPRVQEGFNTYTKKRFANRVFVIPHGVDMDIEVPARVVPAQTRLKLVFIGALYRHKGVDLIPAIIRCLEARSVDVELTILGDGELRDWIQKELMEECADGIVRVKGVVSSLEVREELANADVLLLPTRIEAFGLAIAEAMAQGIVPVVSRLNGITDTIVDDQRTGFLVEPDDITGFVDAVELLYRNGHRMAEMGKAASAWARENLSLSLMGERYLSLFHSLAGSTAPREDTSENCVSMRHLRPSESSKRMSQK